MEPMDTSITWRKKGTPLQLGLTLVFCFKSTADHFGAEDPSILILIYSLAELENTLPRFSRQIKINLSPK